jgi:hypothetical protein
MRRPVTESLARVGLVARGVLYGVMALLALRILLGGNEQADSQGAIAALAQQPFGAVLLGLLALGLAAYAAWQFALAWFGEGLSERVPAVGRGLLWAALAAAAVRRLLGAGASSQSEESVTATVLGLPFGVPLVVAVGLAMGLVGLYNGKQGLAEDWREKLRLGRCSRSTARMVQTIAMGGLVGRMAVFGLVGAFLVRAALRHDPEQGVGLDAALREVASAPYGPFLLGLLALGLAAYAAWCGVRARFERVDTG